MGLALHLLSKRNHLVCRGVPCSLNSVRVFPQHSLAVRLPLFEVPVLVEHHVRRFAWVLLRPLLVQPVVDRLVHLCLGLLLAVVCRRSAFLRSPVHGLDLGVRRRCLPRSKRATNGQRCGQGRAVLLECLHSRGADVPGRVL